MLIMFCCIKMIEVLCIWWQNTMFPFEEAIKAYLKSAQKNNRIWASVNWSTKDLCITEFWVCVNGSKNVYQNMDSLLLRVKCCQHNGWVWPTRILRQQAFVFLWSPVFDPINCWYKIIPCNWSKRELIYDCNELTNDCNDSQCNDSQCNDSHKFYPLLSSRFSGFIKRRMCCVLKAAAREVPIAQSTSFHIIWSMRTSNNNYKSA